MLLYKRGLVPLFFAGGIMLSYFLLALSIGLVVTALISVFIFSESYNMYTIWGIGLIVVGVVILNLWGNVGH